MSHKVKILSVSNVTHDVKKFVVKKPKGYKFTPGQATSVAIDKSGLREEMRPFTFTSLNDDENLEFIIKKYPKDKYPNHRGTTENIHKLKLGDRLILKEPWGTINYKDKGVFIAGGAGITPFVAIFRQLFKENKLKGNMLIFSNKKKEDVILEHELKKMFENSDLVFTLTKNNLSEYENGRVDEEFLKKHVDNFKQNFYICGPKEMVSDLKTTLAKLGANTDSIVFEE